MAIVMNGFSTGSGNAGSYNGGITPWLYDTATGLNVTTNPNPPPAQVEYQNISQAPGTAGQG